MTDTRIRCLCGAVTVRIEGKPGDQFYCHCDDCRAASSGPYVAVAVYPAQAVVVHGELQTWTIRSLLFPPGFFAPAFHIQCRYAVLPIKDDLPHYEGFPAKFGGSDETVDW